MLTAVWEEGESKSDFSLMVFFLFSYLSRDNILCFFMMNYSGKDNTTSSSVQRTSSMRPVFFFFFFFCDKRSPGKYENSEFWARAKRKDVTEGRGREGSTQSRPFLFLFGVSVLTICKKKSIGDYKLHRTTWFLFSHLGFFYFKIFCLWRSQILAASLFPLKEIPCTRSAGVNSTVSYL